MGESVIIPDPNATLMMFKHHDETYSTLFAKLDKGTVKLEDDNLSINDRFNVIASVEFLAVRLQVLIKVEKDNLDQLMTFKDHLAPTVVTMLAVRKNKLIEKEKNVEDIINSFKSTAYIVYNTKQYA